MRLEEMSGHKCNAPDAGEIFDILEKNCSKWISATNWLPAYRGSKMIDPYEDFVKIKARPHKQDPDVPEHIQEKFDLLLWNKGHEALLKNSVHVIGDLKEAKTYGRPFVMFPIGNFDISWSPKVISLMGSLYQYGTEYSNLIELIPTYKHNDLLSAIRSGKEILVKCDEYYKVDLDLWNTISA